MREADRAQLRQKKRVKENFLAKMRATTFSYWNLPGYLDCLALLGRARYHHSLTSGASPLLLCLLALLLAR